MCGNLVEYSKVPNFMVIMVGLYSLANIYKMCQDTLSFFLLRVCEIILNLSVDFFFFRKMSDRLMAHMPVRTCIHWLLYLSDF